MTNVTVVGGHVTVLAPWSPREGLSAHARDSVLKDALRTDSRLVIRTVPGGYQKEVVLDGLDAKIPFLRWADPAYKNRQAKVAGLSMDAYPFRPPAARVTGVTGTFDFNDDSLWWKGAAVKMPQSAMNGDGVYNMANGDLHLALKASPASFSDFTWIYDRLPAEGGGTAQITVQWKGAMQDYMVRSSDLHAGTARVQGDIGATVTDTVFFHDASLRFSGLTTQLIEHLDPTMRSPRQGVLAGTAKFDGTSKWMKLDADVAFAATGRGTSRIIAQGWAGLNGKPVVVSARDLHVRVTPLQIDIAKVLFPTLPVEGTLTGVATLNGSGANQLVATGIDISHTDGPNVSHATGTGSFHTIARQTMDLDLIASPFALPELTRFAPTLKLKGLANGPVHAHGPLDASVVDTRLALAGNGEFGLRGTVDFLSKDLGYDVVADATRLDLNLVMIGGMATSFNGVVRANGRGFKPETQVATIAMNFGPSSIDTIGVDSIALNARLANGIATIDSAVVTGSGLRGNLSGQIGLDSNYTGTLQYGVKLDSLAKFARFIPGASTPDTAIIQPRPLIAYQARRRARADSVRVAKETEVARALGGAPPVRLVVSDTPRAIPKGLLSGSANAKGTIAGSIDRFSLNGTADATGLVVQGNAVRKAHAAYSLTDALTKQSRATLQLGADSINAYGFSFDSLTTNIGYAAPGGTVAVAVHQSTGLVYSLGGGFTLDTVRNEIRLDTVTLRFDSTQWKSTHTSTMHFGRAGLEITNLELASGPGRRIYANGLLPTKGTANFDFEVTDFAVENVAQLLQSDLPLTGRLNLDAHVTGSAESPTLAGKVDFVKGTYNEVRIPEVHGTAAYANRVLTTNAAAVDSVGRTVAGVKGTLPIDLALSGVTGSRILDLPINLALTSDSVPLTLLAQFTDAVTDVGGKAFGNVTATGTLKKPVLRGNVALSDAQFRIAATGALIEKLNGSAHMTGDTVYIDSIAGVSGGPLRVGGTVAVGGGHVPVLNLVHTAQDATFLKNERGEVHADVNIKIEGPVTAASVTGQVSVLHGVLYIPESSGKKIIGSDDPALFNVLDTTVAVQRDLFPAQSPIFKNLRVDVDVLVERGTWVRSRDANVEVFTDGPMKVAAVGDALSLTGVVNADRGEYTFLSKRFQIKRGSALFIGTPDLNPTLQITAEYQVKQATGATNIHVIIGGSVLRPRISLESDAQPPLSQSDLLSYLAFGSSSGSLLQVSQTSLSSQQGGNLLNLAATRLTGIALGVALDELEGNAARSLGVDVFNITPSDLPLSTSSNVNSFLLGTEIEAGRYITPQTFVSAVASPGSFACLRRSVANSSCSPPGATITRRTSKGFRFEASFTPRFILDAPTLAGQTGGANGQFGAFLIREWRF
ncbi:MAG: translocation/assembly module TamB domain-containing protein [bacterium]